MTGTVDPSPSLPAPRRLFLDFQSAVAGRYALERELGRGGMGVVFLARDLRLDRVVAVKLLPPECATDSALRDRFLREARTAAKLSHPHVVPIHAVEDAGDFVFFVMAYVEGETLGARIRRAGALPPRDAARLLREVAWALAYAHAQGVVHRDVKAENILLEARTGRALVADFGIARLVQGPGVSGEGELVGTPEYMSPEQASAHAVDGRSDLYALGVVGYYALSGRLPFTGSTAAAVLVKQLREPPPPLSGSGPLVAAVRRCLEKDPAGRFQNGEELADALGAALEERRDLPVPIRAFLSESQSRVRAQFLGPFLGAAILVPLGLGMLLQGVFSGQPPALFRIGLAAVAGLLLSAAVASPVALVVRGIRRLLRAGYRHVDLVRALEVEVARRAEEQEFAEGTRGATRWARLMRGKMYASLGVTAAAAAAAFFVPYPAALVVFGVFGLSGATALATGLAAVAASRARLDHAEQRRLGFWRGRLGRWLFNVARFRLRGAAPLSAAADRPTEVALGLAALDLFEALPEENRRQLRALPDTVRGLEQDAGRLRQAAGDSGPRRQEAGRRLAQALTALETIRLDLLRLHGGVGSQDRLTQDLEAAREVGREVDRLLSALDELSPPA